MVARRAAGEYAVLDACRRIWNSYRRKERSVYTEFLRVIFANGGDGRVSLAAWDEYERAARAVLAEHPEVAPPPKLDPAPEQRPGPPHPGQLKRHQILAALRRPQPKRDLGDPG